MSKSFLVPLFVLLFSTTLLAQPAWVNTTSREQNFPQKDFLTGFSSVKITESVADGIVDAEEFAVMNIGESIFLEVISFPSGTPADEVQYFQKETLTNNQLVRSGLQVEHYFDEDEEVVYAFSYLKKRELIKTIFTELSDKMSQLKDRIRSFDYIAPTANQLSKLSADLVVARSYSEILSRLDIANKTVLMTEQQKLFEEILDEQLEALKSSSDLSIEDQIFLFAQTLKNEIKIEEFGVATMTFKNTELVSPFSKYLTDQLKESLIDQGFKIDTKTAFQLISNYRVRDEQVLITLSVKEYFSGEVMRTLSSESMRLPIEQVIDLGLLYEPEERHQNNSMSNFILNARNGGAQVDLVTQKGTRKLAFESGETLELYVSTSRAVFITIINVWDDGTQVLLLENYYIGEDQLNQEVILPFEWNVQCPCGTEYLKLFAQKNPFDELPVEERDGFDVVDVNLKYNFSTLRAQQLKKSKMDPEFYYGESNLIINTLEAN